MDKAVFFDALAAGYDSSFTYTAAGWEQRMQTRKWIALFLDPVRPLNILELNCGTGEDACWMASKGHEVIATDISEEMISNATIKADGILKPKFIVADNLDVRSVVNEQKFDLIVSNFSGFNCHDPLRLEKLNDDLISMLHPAGVLVVGVFGKNCLWEMMYYSLNGNFRSAFRRWKQTAMVSFEERTQPVYYYSPKDLENRLQGFSLSEKRPIGLFTPPSYLHAWTKKRKRLVSFFATLDRTVGHFQFLSSFADHSLLVFKKKVQ